MELLPLTQKLKYENEPKLEKKLVSLSQLLDELKTKQLKEEVITEINQWVTQINNTNDIKSLRKIAHKNYHKIITLLVKQEKLTPKGYYRNIWLAMGMAAFGVPLGTTFGIAMENMAFLGIGIPIGLAIGLAIGTVMDNKAAKNGTQLNTDYEI